jgi:glycosyltransferase involved in cell wall biosynthesis
MRIAYVNTYYKSKHYGGGHVHMGQFVANAVALGHEIWAYPNNEYPQAHIIPTSRLPHIMTMRKMDVCYVRLENKPPNVCKWALPPHRWLYGFPLVVWEFNSTPEEGLMRGEPEEEIQKSIKTFRHYGRGCDIAVCMTQHLGDYIKDKLGIRRVLIMPNGSDPELFKPDVPTVKRMEVFKEKFNIVWIGSAKLIYHDFEILRRAAQLLWERGDGERIIFHIIGPELKGAMAEMSPNVFYWGPDTYEKLPNWLAAMDVGLYITHGGPTYLATPLKLFDYLASGLTVVSTSQPFFIRDLFARFDQTDLLVPQGDFTYLADVLTGLASNPERVRRQGQLGRQLIIDQYNWRQSVKDTMNALEELLEERKNGKQT